MGIKYFRTRQSVDGISLEGESTAEGRQFHSEDEPFARRYTRSRSSTNSSGASSPDVDPLEEDVMMQAGFHSTIYRDMLNVLGSSYTDEIDVCPTWWRRSAVKVGTSDASILNRLASVARSLSRPSDADLNTDMDLDEETGAHGTNEYPQFPMDLTGDKRWVSCPTENFSPLRFLDESGHLDESRLLSRTREGYLQLDF